MLQVATIEDIKGFHNEQLALISEIKKELSEINRPDPDRLVSRTELAEKILGVSESTVDNMRRKGIIKAYYIGVGMKRGKPKFRIYEVLQALKNQH